MAELSLADMAAVWRRDLVTNVIPFWEKHSLDREHGGYFTCCDRDGKILDDSKYMWLRPDGTPFNACKGGNYKGFFHVPRALLFSIRAAERCLAARG